ADRAADAPPFGLNPTQRKRARLGDGCASVGTELVARSHGGHAAASLVAAVLPRSVVSSKLTFWPSIKPRIPAASTALMWTKTSFEPSSGWMKPKPFWGLNHLTLPVGMYLSPHRMISAHAHGNARYLCAPPHPNSAMS